MKWNGQELANPRNSGRHEQQQGETGGASAPIQLRTNAELEWHMVWQGAGSTKTWSVFKYSNALNPIVSGSVLLCLYLRVQRGKHERGNNDIYLLACLLCSFFLSYFSLYSLAFPPHRPYDGIFLFFLLFRLCNS